MPKKSYNNTSKPTSLEKLEKAKAGIEKHLERHPKDLVSVTRIENLARRLRYGGKRIKY